MNLATNAKEIMHARMRGFRPSDMVMVSLVGPVWASNPVVFAKGGEKYDWRWVRDLDVCVYINGTVDWADTVKAIALCRPSYLCIWDDVGNLGAHMYLVPTPADIGKPVRMWKYELDYLLWLDFQNQDFIDGKTYDGAKLCS